MEVRTTNDESGRQGKSRGSNAAEQALENVNGLLKIHEKGEVSEKFIGSAHNDASKSTKKSDRKAFQPQSEGSSYATSHRRNNPGV